MSAASWYTTSKPPESSDTAARRRPGPQIEYAKIVRRGRPKFRALDIRTTDPVSFLLEPADKVTRDEAARATHESLRHRAQASAATIRTRPRRER